MINLQQKLLHFVDVLFFFVQFYLHRIQIISMTFFEVSFVVFEFPEKAFMTRVFVVGVVQHLLLQVLELLLLPFKIEDGLVCLFLVHSDFG